MARTLERNSKRREAAATDDYVAEEDEFEEVDDDEEFEEAPKRRSPRSAGKKKGKKKAAPALRGGWDEFERAKAAGSKFPDKFKPNAEETVIRFLEDAPFASYRMHWFNELKGQGKFGFVCVEDDCPACDELNDNPSVNVAFNIVVFNDGDPSVMVLNAGTRLGKLIKSQNESRNGPLTRPYWAISATGESGSYTPNLTPIKERDLEEDWEVIPLSEAELEELTEAAFDASSLDQPDPAGLEAAVDKILAMAD